MKQIAFIFFLFLAVSLNAQTNNISTETNLFPNAEEIPALDQGESTPTDFSVNEPLVDLQYPNNPIQDIIAIYEQLTGKRVIKDPNLAGLNFSIMANQIPKSEAIRLIESAMLLNNYAIVPAPDNSIKVLNLAGKQPRNEGAPIYANADDLPLGEKVVSYFMPLNHLTPAEVVPIFQQAIPPHAYGVYVPVANAQAVIITESSAVIRQLIAMKELIDVPPTKMVSKFVTLTRTDATTVAEAITKLLETRKAGAAQPGAPAGGTPAAVEALFDQKTQSEKNPTLSDGDVKLVPDPRTNRILVITKVSNFAYIKNLIEEFDSATELADPLELQLKYISASELLPILQDLLKEDEKQNATQTASAGNRNAADRQQQNPTSIGSSGEGSLNLSDRLSAPTENQAPEAITVGKTRIIADNRQNTLLVLGPPGSLDKIQSVVEKLDRRPLQVYLATVIGQLALNDTMELGFDILQKFESFGKESGGLAASSLDRTVPTLERPLSSIANPLSLVNNGAFSALAGLNVYAAIGSSLNAYVKALQGTGRFKVIQRPFIFTSNNKKATILSGEEVPVPTATVGSLVDSTNNQALNASIQFKDVALKLEVIPLINSEKEVTLQIAQINNVRSGSANVAGIQVPTIAKQELNTSVTVSNKSVIVLGGLIREEARRDTTGIPLLSKIPVLGALFRETRKENVRSELIILIQPTVIQDGQDLAEANQEEKARAPFISPETYQMAEPEPLRLRIDEEKLKLKKKKEKSRNRE
ncbi:MAG: secretin N-terminal domain-containing protein [Verrucomicrobiia bacterium]